MRPSGGAGSRGVRGRLRSASGCRAASSKPLLLARFSKDRRRKPGATTRSRDKARSGLCWDAQEGREAACSLRDLSWPRGVVGVRGAWMHRLSRRAAKMLALAVIGATLLWGSALSPSALAAGRDSTSVTLVQQCISFMLHLDKHLMAIISKFGEQKTYGLLAAIVFCETGLVVTPFLPGDSLLFACGTFAALGSLKLQTVILVLLVAAVAGDAVNYCVGQWVGRRILASGLISSKNIEKTERFYGKHGPKTIVLARFVPIVRTFAPFVAGVGSMEWREFSIYNVVGAIAWTTSFTLLGFFFGNLPFVQHNFTLVVLGIVAISVLPVVYEVMTTTK